MAVLLFQSQLEILRQTQDYQCNDNERKKLKIVQKHRVYLESYL